MGRFGWTLDMIDPAELIGNAFIALALAYPLVLGYAILRDLYKFDNFFIGSIYTAGLYLHVLQLPGQGDVVDITLYWGLIFSIVVLALLINRVVLFSLNGARAEKPLIASLGLYFSFQQLFSVVFGDAVLFTNTGRLAGFADLSNWTPEGRHAVAIIISLGAAAVFAIVARGTEIGMRMRAVADSPGLAAALRIDVNRVQVTGAVIAICLVLAASMLAAPESGAHPMAGFGPMLLAFPVCMLGGSPFFPQFHAVLAAVVFGQQLLAAYIPGEWVQSALYAFVLLALLSRPVGRFRWKR